MITGLTKWCLTSNSFATNQKGELFKALEGCLDNSAVGMSAEQYLKMCEQLGEEPDPDKIPKDLSDMPDFVLCAIEIFNSLPDNYSGGMATMYVGKDYSALPVLFDLHLIEPNARLGVFEVISWLDNRSRKHAQKEAEKASKRK